MNRNKYNLRILLIALLAFVLPSICMPYEVNVHQEMSVQAFKASISDFDYLAELGINSTQKFNGNRDTAQDLVEAGSKSEDAVKPFVRPLYHFFDPITGYGLNAPGLSGLDSAPDWALGTGLLTNNENVLSARAKMFKALTSKGFGARDSAWAGLFKRLGHMAHLIQDMSQPAHVRNDPHLSPGQFADTLFRDYSRYERLDGRLTITAPSKGIAS